MIQPSKLRYLTGPLISFANGIIDGLITHQDAVGMKQNTLTMFNTAIDVLGGAAGQPGSEALLAQANVTLGEKIGELRLATSAARKLALDSVNVLKSVFGNQHSPAWQQVGFSSSLRIPNDPVWVLTQMSAYLQAHPTAEFSATGVTAANLLASVEALGTARRARDTAAENVSHARAQRNADREVLYRRILGAKGELGTLLTPSDVRWYAFGFDRPIDGKMPGPVEDLAATPTIPGTVELTWAASVRATQYRVQWHLQGTPEEVVSIGLIADPAVTLHNIPNGATIVVLISAYNKTGETQPTTLEVTAL